MGCVNQLTPRRNLSRELTDGFTSETHGLSRLPRDKTSISGQCPRAHSWGNSICSAKAGISAWGTKDKTFFPVWLRWTSPPVLPLSKVSLLKIFGTYIKTAWSRIGPESLSPTHQFKVGMQIQTWIKHVSQALKRSFIKGYSSSDWREIQKERDGQDRGEMESHHCLKLASIKQKAGLWWSALSPFGKKGSVAWLLLGQFLLGTEEAHTDQTHCPDTALGHELKPRRKWRWTKSADYQIINGKVRYAGGCICAH